MVQKAQKCVILLENRSGSCEAKRKRRENSSGAYCWQQAECTGVPGFKSYLSGFPQNGQDSRAPWSTCFLQFGHAETLTEIALSSFIKFIFVLLALHSPIAPSGKNIAPLIPIIGAPICCPNSGKKKVITKPTIMSSTAENDMMPNALA